MPRILVVEDDNDLQFLYKTILSRLGHEVTAAETVQDGINRLTHDQFDLLILDMNLPDQPGIRVIEYVRQYLNGIPIMVVSANNQWQADCADLGVDTFLLKPVTLADLKSMVARMIQSQ